MSTKTQNVCGVALTELEAAMIRKFATDDYSAGADYCETWSFSVCGTRADSGVMSSLNKKGLALSNGGGMGDDASVRLTDLGMKVLVTLVPEVRGKVEPRSSYETAE